MKYFIVSDIHGCYKELLKALVEAGFDAKNPQHKLISLGDAFDRGPNSKEVLQFLMNTNAITLWGNHETRLAAIVFSTCAYNSADIENGIRDTAKSFFGYDSARLFTTWRRNPNDLFLMFDAYLKQSVYALEFDDCIMTHGWVPYQVFYPTKLSDYTVRFQLLDNWRDSTVADWWNSTWADTRACIQTKIYPDKRLIVGHRGIGAYLRQPLGKVKTPSGQEAFQYDLSTYDNGNVCGIDGSVYYPYGGRINVLVYENQNVPKLYRGK